MTGFIAHLRHVDGTIRPEYLQESGLGNTTLYNYAKTILVGEPLRSLDAISEHEMILDQVKRNDYFVYELIKVFAPDNDRTDWLNGALGTYLLLGSARQGPHLKSGDVDHASVLLEAWTDRTEEICTLEQMVMTSAKPIAELMFTEPSSVVYKGSIILLSAVQSAYDRQAMEAVNFQSLKYAGILSMGDS